MNSCKFSFKIIDFQSGCISAISAITAATCSVKLLLSKAATFIALNRRNRLNVNGFYAAERTRALNLKTRTGICILLTWLWPKASPVRLTWLEEQWSAASRRACSRNYSRLKFLSRVSFCRSSGETFKTLRAAHRHSTSSWKLNDKKAATQIHSVISRGTMESKGLLRCKIVVVGDSKCGKTALLHVFAKDSYPEVSQHLIKIKTDKSAANGCGRTGA